MIDKLCKTFRASKKIWLCRWSLRNAIDLSMERLTPTFGVELKTYSVVRFFFKMNAVYLYAFMSSFLEYLLWIMFDITEKEKKIRTEFFSPQVYCMAEATSLPSCTRLCFVQLQDKSVSIKIMYVDVFLSVYKCT